MGAWVLIVFMNIGGNTTLVTMQEFTSAGACAYAKQTVEAPASLVTPSSNITAKCIPK